MSHLQQRSRALDRARSRGQNQLGSSPDGLLSTKDFPRRKVRMRSIAIKRSLRFGIILLALTVAPAPAGAADSNPCADPNHDDDTDAPHLCALPGTCLPGDIVGDRFGHSGVGVSGLTRIRCDPGGCRGRIQCQTCAGTTYHRYTPLKNYVICTSEAGNQSTCKASDYPVSWNAGVTTVACYEEVCP